MASDAPEGAELWRGVHPLSVLVNFVPRTWSLLRTAWPLLLALLYGGRNEEGIANGLTLIVFFLLPFLSSIVHALTLRYRVAQGRLELRSGLLNRQARTIALDRIQNVERVQNIFQRAAGLVEVRIETASGTEVEGLLSAVSTSAADALVAALGAGRAAEAPGPAEPEVLAACSPLDLVWYGAADLRLGAVSMLLALLFEVEPDFGGALADGAGGLLGAAVVVAALSGGWLLGIGAAVVRYYGFTLSRTREALVAEHGLLTRRRTELRRSKVQVITWTEPLLLRLLGLGTLSIETAAAREEGSGTERSVASVPCVEPSTVSALVAEAVEVGALALGPALALDRPHRLALAHAVTASALRWTVLALLASWLLFPYGLIAIGIAPLAIGLAALDVSQQGWLLTDEVLVSRRGVLDRRTAVVPRAKLQSATVEQGPVLRRFGLGVLTIRVAGARLDLPALSWQQATALQDALIRSMRPRVTEVAPPIVSSPELSPGDG